MTRPLEERFWEKVEQGHPLDCWEWQGGKTPTGYGKFGVTTGVQEYAHRMAFRLVRGAIPDHLEIDHLCNNRWCCNPYHLECVTHAENMRRRDEPQVRSLLTDEVLELIDEPVS